MSGEIAELVVITGPTASGKGSLAFELSLRLSREIISLDSMKVYREMDVGTAKPSPERRSRVQYHLLDILDPNEEFSTGEYLPLLESTIADCQKRGQNPIIAGGTALYLKGYLDGFQKGPEADWGVRNRLREEALQLGPEALHERLRGHDPQAASKIHPRDSRRIVRALEVVEKTGRPISEEWAWKAHPVPPRHVRIFGLEWPREELYARINLRVERMVEAGLFEEAVRLRQRIPPLSRTAAQAIGLKEVWQGADLARSRKEVVERIQQGTRRFAKSQLTWFRKMPIEWIPTTGTARVEDLADEVLRRLTRDSPQVCC